MRASRGTTAFDNVLYTSSTLALRPKDGTLAWHYQHAPGESLDLDEVFERVLVDIGDQKVVFTIGKPGILWKLDRRNGKFLGYKETVFQNVFESIDPKNGTPTYRGRHPRAGDQQVGAVVPEHRRRPQLAGDELSRAGRRAHHPAQPVVHGDVGPQDRVHERVGRHRRRPPLLRDARHRRQRRQARGVRREDDERSVEPRAAGAVSDRRHHHRRAASASSAISIARSAHSTSRPARRSGRRGSARRCRAIR